MAEPTVIATLLPADSRCWAENSFLLSHNETFYRKPTKQLGPRVSSLDLYPDDDQYEPPPTEYHRLELNTHNFPIGGLLFGSDPQRCHILLGKNSRVIGISGVHFSLTYDSTGNFILKDSSACGMSVSYGGQGSSERRRHFTWTINARNENQELLKTEVHIPREGDLEFTIQVAKHDNCKALENFRATVLEKNRNIIPSPNRFRADHPLTKQPSKISDLDQSPIYITRKKLGEGTSGIVDLVFDVSTTVRYAKKRFKAPENEEDQKKSTWLRKVEQEIRIMKNNSHQHTVPVIDYRIESSPWILLPYYPLGNLQSHHAKMNLSSKDLGAVFHQSLLALKYLHGRGVTHRDLKPENILVESQDPLKIRIADFGLAKVGSALETQCGTPIYIAPEIVGNSKGYTSAVDLWSLGVIIMQYAHGLPPVGPKPASWMSKSWIDSWCTRIFIHSLFWNGHPLTDITRKLLEFNASQRISAVDCLAYGYEHQLFEVSTSYKEQILAENVEPELIPTLILDNKLPEEREPSICAEGNELPHPEPYAASDIQHRQKDLPETEETSRLQDLHHNRSNDNILVGRNSAQLLPSTTEDTVMTEQHNPLEPFPKHFSFNLETPKMQDLKSSGGSNALSAISSVLVKLVHSLSLTYNNGDNGELKQLAKYFAVASIKNITMIQTDSLNVVIICSINGDKDCQVARITNFDQLTSASQFAAQLRPLLISQHAKVNDPGVWSVRDGLTGRTQKSQQEAATMRSALKLGLARSTQKFYRVPFRTGKVSVRKSDGWFNLTQILTQAGLGLKQAAEFRKNNKGRYKIVSGRVYGGTYVSGKTALGCCEEYGLKDVPFLISDFTRAYKWAMKNLNAKPITFSGLVNVSGQTFLPTTTLFQQESGASSRPVAQDTGDPGPDVDMMDDTVVIPEHELNIGWDQAVAQDYFASLLAEQQQSQYATPM